MAAKYYLQTAGSSEVWEEVDEYTFTNRKHVVNDEDEPRYSGTYVLVNDGNIAISGLICQKVLGIVCRFLAVQPPTGNITGGYLRTPEMVKLQGMSKNKDSRILHVMHGDNFVRVRKHAA